VSEATPIALLGTSADPPTQGHKALLAGLLTLYPRVVTWASDNPLKHHIADLEERCLLLRSLVEAIGDPRLHLAQELSSPWAVETLRRAQRRWPDCPLHFVVGGDLVPQVRRWRNVEQVLRACTLAVVPRHGWSLAAEDLEELRQRGGRIRLLPLRIPASASSRIRERADPAQLPPELLPVLLEHNLLSLYGLPSP
jgi:nicotinate-nucleotide adenylyltransferase